MNRGTATFTLDYGTCPKWLFDRMVKLGREMTYVLVAEYGPREFIKRIADPVWFQSLGTVLAFDWNSSGITTILTAALKEAIRGEEKDLGIFICGGKGKTSRKTPDEITAWGGKLSFPLDTIDNLVYNSKMAAKVDSSLVQDGYQIYHHAFFFSNQPAGGGAWTVVQQGMNTNTQTARRYHWFSDNIEDLVNEPHTGIASQLTQKSTLNLTATKSKKNREVSVDLTSNGFQTLMRDIEIVRKHSSSLSKMVSVKSGDDQLTLLKLEDKEFYTHSVEWENFWDSPYLKKILEKLSFEKPDNYESLLATPGVGPKTIRALSLVSEIIYGANPSYEDPARYSFAHGGKDATPYPVDRKIYDQTIATMAEVIRKSRINPKEKDNALKRLNGQSL